MPSWTVVAFFMIVMLIGLLLGGIAQGISLADEDLSFVQTLLSFDVLDIKWAGPFPYPWLNSDYLSAMTGLLTWNYSFFDFGFGTWIRALLMALSAGFSVIMVLQLARLIRGGG